MAAPVGAVARGPQVAGMVALPDFGASELPTNAIGPGPMFTGRRARAISKWT
jgi:hypothetical protein